MFCGFLSIPLSALATFVVLYLLGSTVNTMILGGREQIPLFRARFGVRPFTTGVVRCRYDGDSVVLLAISEDGSPGCHNRIRPIEPLLGWSFQCLFNRIVGHLLDAYERLVRWALKRPAMTVTVLAGIFVASLAIDPILGVAFFPRTDAGQFTINMKVPTGTRIEATEQYVGKFARPGLQRPVTVLDNVVKVDFLQSPTEVDHYQIQRVVDLYVTPSGEDLGNVTRAIRKTIADSKLQANMRVNLLGMVQGMEKPFNSFGLRLCALFHPVVSDSDRTVPLIH